MLIKDYIINYVISDFPKGSLSFERVIHELGLKEDQIHDDIIKTIMGKISLIFNPKKRYFSIKVSLF